MARQRIKFSKARNPWKAAIKTTDINGDNEKYRKNFDKAFSKKSKT